MSEFLNSETLGVIITAAVAVVSAFLSMIVVAINTRKAKLKLEEEKTKLEQKNVELQQAIIDGAFIICPNCGLKIRLKDVEIKTERSLE